MRKSFNTLFIILSITSLFISCSPSEGGKEQIANENKGINTPLYETAYKLFYKGKYSKAVDLLSNYVFKQNGKSLIFHALLIKSAEKINKIDEVMTSYQKLKFQKYYMFAKGYLLILQEKRKKDSLKIFKRLRYFFPKNPVVQMYLGYLYVINNRANLAVSILIKSTDNLKQFPFNKYYLALAYYNTGDKEKAKEALNRAIETFPSYMEKDIKAANRLKKRIQ